MATILVVDDDADIRLLLRIELTAEHHQIVEAADGAQALTAMAAEAPDLVLLDMMMPVMDGWRFCEEKRRRPELDKIPLAVMSAAANLRRGLGPCTPQAVLPKPFLLDDLLRSIDTALAA